MKKCAASMTPKAFGPIPSALANDLNLHMSHLIPTNKRARKTLLASLYSNLTASNVGFAFLSAQITDLEQRCAAMRNRITKRPGRTASRAQPA